MATQLELIEKRALNPGWDAIIKGPQGSLLLKDLMWIEPREDILEMYYWDAWGVLQGMYHCCWSIPGKVVLLPA
jgi:hypothetical protein